MAPSIDCCSGTLRGPKGALCTHSQKPLLTVKRALEAARIAPVANRCSCGRNGASEDMSFNDCTAIPLTGVAVEALEAT
jgi:hypothetical protein